MAPCPTIGRAPFAARKQGTDRDFLGYESLRFRSCHRLASADSCGRASRDDICLEPVSGNSGSAPGFLRLDTKTRPVGVLRCPVFHFKSFDAPKFLYVVGHDNGALTTGMSGNHEVIGSNGLPFAS